MSLVENHALGLIEALSGQTIEDENRQGFTRCKDATEAAARKVKRVFEC